MFTEVKVTLSYRINVKYLVLNKFIQYKIFSSKKKTNSLSSYSVLKRFILILVRSISDTIWNDFPGLKFQKNLYRMPWQCVRNEYWYIPLPMTSKRYLCPLLCGFFDHHPNLLYTDGSNPVQNWSKQISTRVMTYKWTILGFIFHFW